MHTQMQAFPTIPRGAWQENLRGEADHWRQWIQAAAWHADKAVMEDFKWRTTRRCDVREKDMFAPYLRPACPPGTQARILDVGAGPLTWFPRKWFTRDYNVVPLDPLADEFDAMLAEANITPPVKTIKGEAEKLTEQFEPESFHLVFCRNAFEQFYDPMTALRQMLAVVKENCWVILIQEDYRADEQQKRGPWTIEEQDADLIMNAPDGGKIDLGMEFADVATLRTSRSWHWPWVLGAFKKEALA